jgi:hypothetical protein
MGAAPNGQVRANLPGALPYPGKAVMSWAALIQEVGWNTLAIVPNSQPKRAFSILDLGFNVARARVLEGIG